MITSLYVNTLEELEKAIIKRHNTIWIDVTLQSIPLGTSALSGSQGTDHGFNDTVLWLIDQLFHQLTNQPIEEQKKQQIIQEMTQHYKIELKNGLICLSIK